MIIVSSPRHALKPTTNYGLNFPPKEQVGTRNEGMEIWVRKRIVVLTCVSVFEQIDARIPA